MENEATRKLYEDNWQAIEDSMNSVKVHRDSQQVQSNIKPAAVVALQFMAAQMPMEADAAGDLTTLKTLIIELQDEVKQSNALKPAIRTWLLDLLRLMADGLNRFENRGSRGLKKEMHAALGNLVHNYEVVNTIKKQDEGLFKRIVDAVNLMGHVASLAEKAAPAIDFAERLLPYFSESQDA